MAVLCSIFPGPMMFSGGTKRMGDVLQCGKGDLAQSEDTFKSRDVVSVDKHCQHQEFLEA